MSGLAYRNGSLAMMLALVLASAAALLARASSPLEPVADAIMDRTPVAIAIPLLLRLGPLAQPLALCGAAALALLIGGLLALVYPSPAAPAPLPRAGRPSPPSPLPDAGEGSRPTGKEVAVNTEADTSLGDSPSPRVRERGEGLLRAALGTVILIATVVVAGIKNPAVVAVLVAAYAFALRALNGGPARAARNGRAERAGRIGGRRQFLLHNGRIVGGFAALVALLYLQPLAHRLRTRAAGRALFPWSPPRPRKPGFDLAGLSPEVTPVGQFYQMDEDLARPDIDPGGWALSIEGLVRRPVRLTFADLLALPRHDEWVTQRCVSNPVDGEWMSTALFSGVAVQTLLDQAGGRLPGGSAVLFRADPDDHEEAVPLALALDGHVMLAYAMDGRLLEQAHGFPARSLIPGYYGYKSVKWVTTLRVTADARQGFWERRGWVSLPAARTVARIDVAERGPRGLLVAGVAFAGRRGVRAVQVQVEDGPWHAAALHAPTLSPLTWVQWRLTLPPHLLPPRGGPQLHVRARAIDGRGEVQTAAEHDQYPSGATGYHTIVVSSQ